MKVTIDSGEPLDDALRVIGALYGVDLVVSDNGHAQTDLPRQVSARPTSSRGRRAPRPPAAAPSRSGRGKKGSGANLSTQVSNIELRAWARQNGFKVSERGRVASTVIAAYRAAHDA